MDRIGRIRIRRERRSLAAGAPRLAEINTVLRNDVRAKSVSRAPTT